MKLQIIARLLTSVFLLFPAFIFSQKVLEPDLNPVIYKTEIIDPDIGLSAPFVNCMYEDRYGFIWIGTQYGLDLYDGYSVTHVGDVVSDSARTSMDWIWSITEDNAGNLWVCSAKGLFRYDRQHNTFEMHLPNLDQPDSEDNVVYAINQDSRGIYWLLTKGGLFSYNKKENLFKDYKKDTIITDESDITTGVFLQWWNEVRFHEDQAGSIWIGTWGEGLKKYDREMDRFLTFSHDSDDPESISNDTAFCINEDKNHRLWVSTVHGLNKMIDSTGKFQQYYHDEADDKSLVSNWTFQLFSDRNDNLWIGGLNGFSKYNFESDNFDNYVLSPEFAPNPRRSVDNLYLTRITEDSNGNLWVLIWLRGLLSFNPVTGEIAQYYYDPDYKNRLVPDLWANKIHEDRSGSIWISGIDRITRSDPVFKPFQTITPGMLELNSEGIMEVTSIYHDNRGTLWIGVDEYGFLKSTNFIPGMSCDFEQFYQDKRPYCFLQDHKGQLWLGTIDKGLGKVNESDNTVKWYPYSQNPATSSSGEYIGMMYVDQRNIFWIAAYTGGINIFDPESEQFIWIRNEPGNFLSESLDNILVINEDRNGSMWFGSFQFGLSRLEISRGLTDSINLVFAGEIPRYELKFKFKNFKNNPFDPYSLNGNNINDIYTDQSGRLWIGTTNGLNVFNEENESFYSYTESDGLPDNCIFGILEDDHGNLWLSSRKGICKVVLKDGIGPDLIQSVLTYSKEDGLQGDIFFENTCQKTDDGWMYFGGLHGFTVFHPDSIKENPVIPPVYITDIKINNVSVHSPEYSFLDAGLFETKKIELSPKQNFLAFEYVALNYSNAEQNQYRYMMEGLEEDWVEAGTRRYAEYRDLKPGKYTFRVLGSNDDRIWNKEGASIGIIIHSPWYRTFLAYVFYVILLALMILIIIRWRTYRLKKENIKLDGLVKERTRVVEEQNEEISATNAELKEQREEVMATNTRLEEQKEELEQQKEELQITLDQLKETQAQLIQSEKLAALGGLVAGVAHEINTPVGISLTAASSLEEETRKMAELYKKDKISRADFKDYLNTANQSAKLILSNMQRTAEMVQSFKQVSADQSTEEQRKFKLKFYTEDVIRSLYPKLKQRKINIHMYIDEKLELDSFPGAFSQIITNLVLNSLTHGFDEKDEGKIEIKANLEKKKLNFEYSDNGKGIAPENMSKIFEPFFTTNKKIGTGLGMHIIYNLVTQKLNGSIECQSELNKGTRFVIKFPVDIKEKR
jgi:signal transduction histidine kinase/ligand-binding sensor domain-containing protein